MWQGTPPVVIVSDHAGSSTAVLLSPYSPSSPSPSSWSSSSCSPLSSSLSSSSQNFLMQQATSNQQRRRSMPVGSTSTPDSPRDQSQQQQQQQLQDQNASSANSMQQQQQSTANRSSARQGMNIYSRPGSTSSSQASPASSVVESSPRRNSLFNSLRFSKVRKESRDSPNQSPMGSIDQENPEGGGGGGGLQSSPRKLAGLWETFRPRSKSDSRTRKVVSPASAANTTTNSTAAGASAAAGGAQSIGWPPPMASIPSCDEDSMSPPKRKSPESYNRPLYVDTQLANRQGKNVKSSPLAQVIDKLSGTPRHRSLSGNTRDEADRARVRTPSGPAAADHFFAGGGFINRHKLPLPKRSLDSGLDSGGLWCKEVRFFPGSAAHGFLSSQIDDDTVFAEFMKMHKCYDLIPTSAKLVAFDTQLPVKKAFFALVYNGVRAAPLWDSAERQFVGMLTITDFIHILRRYYRSGVQGIKELEEHKIATWREVLMKDGVAKPFVTVDPSESLLKAVQLLCENKVHRLPVMDPLNGNILYILTHKRILRFLYIYINDLPAPEFMQKTPKDLGIGSWGDILTVKQDTLLIDAFASFVDNRVSALPVVDADGRVVDIYAKFDVINLAADKSYNNLEITVRDALKHRSEWFEGVRSCKETDSLALVIQTLVKAEIHRVVITDEEKQPRGIVSLSDILSFLVLKGSDSTMEKMDTS